MKNSPCEGCTRECPNNGNLCSEWKKWFVEHWNRNICRKAPAKREAFQYEHPDRIREMEGKSDA